MEVLSSTSAGDKLPIAARAFEGLISEAVSVFEGWLPSEQVLAVVGRVKRKMTPDQVPRRDRGPGAQDGPMVQLAPEKSMVPVFGWPGGTSIPQEGKFVDR